MNSKRKSIIDGQQECLNLLKTINGLLTEYLSIYQGFTDKGLDLDMHREILDLFRVHYGIDIQLITSDEISNTLSVLREKNASSILKNLEGNAEQTTDSYSDIAAVLTQNKSSIEDKIKELKNIKVEVNKTYDLPTFLQKIKSIKEKKENAWVIISEENLSSISVNEKKQITSLTTELNKILKNQIARNLAYQKRLKNIEAVFDLAKKNDIKTDIDIKRIREELGAIISLPEPLPTIATLKQQVTLLEQEASIRQLFVEQEKEVIKTYSLILHNAQRHCLENFEKIKNALTLLNLDNFNGENNNNYQSINKTNNSELINEMPENIQFAVKIQMKLYQKIFAEISKYYNNDKSKNKDFYSNLNQANQDKFNVLNDKIRKIHEEINILRDTDYTTLHLNKLVTDITTILGDENSGLIYLKKQKDSYNQRAQKDNEDKQKKQKEEKESKKKNEELDKKINELSQKIDKQLKKYQLFIGKIGDCFPHKFGEGEQEVIKIFAKIEELSHLNSLKLSNEFTSFIKKYSGKDAITLLLKNNKELNVEDIPARLESEYKNTLLSTFNCLCIESEKTITLINENEEVFRKHVGNQYKNLTLKQTSSYKNIDLTGAPIAEIQDKYLALFKDNVAMGVLLHNYHDTLKEKIELARIITTNCLSLIPIVEIIAKQNRSLCPIKFAEQFITFNKQKISLNDLNNYLSDNDYLDKQKYNEVFLYEISNLSSSSSLLEFETKFINELHSILHKHENQLQKDKRNLNDCQMLLSNFPDINSQINQNNTDYESLFQMTQLSELYFNIRLNLKEKTKKLTPYLTEAYNLIITVEDKLQQYHNKQEETINKALRLIKNKLLTTSSDALQTKVTTCQNLIKDFEASPTEKQSFDDTIASFHKILIAYQEIESQIDKDINNSLILLNQNIKQYPLKLEFSSFTSSFTCSEERLLFFDIKENFEPALKEFNAVEKSGLVRVQMDQNKLTLSRVNQSSKEVNKEEILRQLETINSKFKSINLEQTQNKINTAKLAMRNLCQFAYDFVKKTEEFLNKEQAEDWIKTYLDISHLDDDDQFLEKLFALKKLGFTSISYLFSNQKTSIDYVNAQFTNDPFTRFSLKHFRLIADLKKDYEYFLTFPIFIQETETIRNQQENLTQLHEQKEEFFKLIYCESLSKKSNTISDFTKENVELIKFAKSIEILENHIKIYKEYLTKIKSYYWDINDSLGKHIEVLKLLSLGNPDYEKKLTIRKKQLATLSNFFKNLESVKQNTHPQKITTLTYSENFNSIKKDFEEIKNLTYQEITNELLSLQKDYTQKIKSLFMQLDPGLFINKIFAGSEKIPQLIKDGDDWRISTHTGYKSLDQYFSVNEPDKYNDFLKNLICQIHNKYNQGTTIQQVTLAILVDTRDLPKEESYFGYQGIEKTKNLSMDDIKVGSSIFSLKVANNKNFALQIDRIPEFLNSFINKENEVKEPTFKFSLAENIKRLVENLNNLKKTDPDLNLPDSTSLNYFILSGNIPFDSFTKNLKQTENMLEIIIRQIENKKLNERKIALASIKEFTPKSVNLNEIQPPKTITKNSSHAEFYNQKIVQIMGCLDFIKNARLLEEALIADEALIKTNKDQTTNQHKEKINKINERLKILSNYCKDSILSERAIKFFEVDETYKELQSAIQNMQQKMKEGRILAFAPTLFTFKDNLPTFTIPPEKLALLNVTDLDTILEKTTSIFDKINEKNKQVKSAIEKENEKQKKFLEKWNVLAPSKIRTSPWIDENLVFTDSGGLKQIEKIIELQNISPTLKEIVPTPLQTDDLPKHKENYLPPTLLLFNIYLRRLSEANIVTNNLPPLLKDLNLESSTPSEEEIHKLQRILKTSTLGLSTIEDIKNLDDFFNDFNKIETKYYENIANLIKESINHLNSIKETHENYQKLIKTLTKYDISYKKEDIFQLNLDEEINPFLKGIKRQLQNGEVDLTNKETLMNFVSERNLNQIGWDDFSLLNNFDKNYFTNLSSIYNTLLNTQILTQITLADQKLGELLKMATGSLKDVITAKYTLLTDEKIKITTPKDSLEKLQQIISINLDIQTSIDTFTAEKTKIEKTLLTEAEKTRKDIEKINKNIKEIEPELLKLKKIATKLNLKDESTDKKSDDKSKSELDNVTKKNEDLSSEITKLKKSISTELQRIIELLKIEKSKVDKKSDLIAGGKAALNNDITKLNSAINKIPSTIESNLKGFEKALSKYEEANQHLTSINKKLIDLEKIELQTAIDKKKQDLKNELKTFYQAQGVNDEKIDALLNENLPQKEEETESTLTVKDENAKLTKEKNELEKVDIAKIKNSFTIATIQSYKTKSDEIEVAIKKIENTEVKELVITTINNQFNPHTTGNSAYNVMPTTLSQKALDKIISIDVAKILNDAIINFEKLKQEQLEKTLKNLREYINTKKQDLKNELKIFYQDQGVDDEKIDELINENLPQKEEEIENDQAEKNEITILTQEQDKLDQVNIQQIQDFFIQSLSTKYLRKVRDINIEIDKTENSNIKNNIIKTINAQFSIQTTGNSNYTDVPNVLLSKALEKIESINITQIIENINIIQLKEARNQFRIIETSLLNLARKNKITAVSFQLENSETQNESFKKLTEEIAGVKSNIPKILSLLPNITKAKQELNDTKPTKITNPRSSQATQYNSEIDEMENQINLITISTFAECNKEFTQYVKSLEQSFDRLEAARNSVTSLQEKIPAVKKAEEDAFNQELTTIEAANQALISEINAITKKLDETYLYFSLSNENYKEDLKKCEIKITINSTDSLENAKQKQRELTEELKKKKECANQKVADIIKIFEGKAEKSQTQFDEQFSLKTKNLPPELSKKLRQDFNPADIDKSNLTIENAVEIADKVKATTIHYTKLLESQDGNPTLLDEKIEELTTNTTEEVSKLNEELIKTQELLQQLQNNEETADKTPLKNEDKPATEATTSIFEKKDTLEKNLEEDKKKLKDTAKLIFTEGENIKRQYEGKLTPQPTNPLNKQLHDELKKLTTKLSEPKTIETAIEIKRLIEFFNRYDLEVIKLENKIITSETDLLVDKLVDVCRPLVEISKDNNLTEDVCRTKCTEELNKHNKTRPSALPNELENAKQEQEFLKQEYQLKKAQAGIISYNIIGMLKNKVGEAQSTFNKKFEEKTQQLPSLVSSTLRQKFTAPDVDISEIDIKNAADIAEQIKKQAIHYTESLESKDENPTPLDKEIEKVTTTTTANIVILNEKLEQTQRLLQQLQNEEEADKDQPENENKPASKNSTSIFEQENTLEKNLVEDKQKLKKAVVLIFEEGERIKQKIKQYEDRLTNSPVTQTSAQQLRGSIEKLQKLKITNPNLNDPKTIETAIEIKNLIESFNRYDLETIEAENEIIKRNTASLTDGVINVYRHVLAVCNNNQTEDKYKEAFNAELNQYNQTRSSTSANKLKNARREQELLKNEFGLKETHAKKETRRLIQALKDEATKIKPTFDKKFTEKTKDLPQDLSNKILQEFNPTVTDQKEITDEKMAETLKNQVLRYQEETLPSKQDKPTSLDKEIEKIKTHTTTVISKLNKELDEIQRILKQLQSKKDNTKETKIVKNQKVPNIFEQKVMLEENLEKDKKSLDETVNGIITKSKNIQENITQYENKLKKLRKIPGIQSTFDKITNAIGEIRKIKIPDRADIVKPEAIQTAIKIKELIDFFNQFDQEFPTLESNYIKGLIERKFEEINQQYSSIKSTFDNFPSLHNESAEESTARFIIGLFGLNADKMLPTLNKQYDINSLKAAIISNLLIEMNGIRLSQKVNKLNLIKIPSKKDNITNIVESQWKKLIEASDQVFPISSPDKSLKNNSGLYRNILFKISPLLEKKEQEEQLKQQKIQREAAKQSEIDKEKEELKPFQALWKLPTNSNFFTKYLGFLNSKSGPLPANFNVSYKDDKGEIKTKQLQPVENETQMKQVTKLQLTLDVILTKKHAIKQQIMKSTTNSYLQEALFLKLDTIVAQGMRKENNIFNPESGRALLNANARLEFFVKQMEKEIELQQTFCEKVKEINELTFPSQIKQKFIEQLQDNFLSQFAKKPNPVNFEGIVANAKKFLSDNPILNNMASKENEINQLKDASLKAALSQEFNEAANQLDIDKPNITLDQNSFLSNKIKITTIKPETLELRKKLREFDMEIKNALFYIEPSYTTSIKEKWEAQIKEIKWYKLTSKKLAKLAQAKNEIMDAIRIAHKAKPNHQAGSESLRLFLLDFQKNKQKVEEELRSIKTDNIANKKVPSIADPILNQKLNDPINYYLEKQLGMYLEKPSSENAGGIKRSVLTIDELLQTFINRISTIGKSKVSATKDFEKFQASLMKDFSYTQIAECFIIGMLIQIMCNINDEIPNLKKDAKPYYVDLAKNLDTKIKSLSGKFKSQQALAAAYNHLLQLGQPEVPPTSTKNVSKPTLFTPQNTSKAIEVKEEKSEAKPQITNESEPGLSLFIQDQIKYHSIGISYTKKLT